MYLHVSSLSWVSINNDNMQYREYKKDIKKIIQ